MNSIATAPITNHSASCLPWWTPDPSSSSTKKRVAAERLQATQECGFFCHCRVLMVPVSKYLLVAVKKEINACEIESIQASLLMIAY